MSIRDSGALAERKAISSPEKPISATLTEARLDKIAIQSAVSITPLSVTPAATLR